jgi:hypothetical protein
VPQIAADTEMEDGSKEQRRLQEGDWRGHGPKMYQSTEQGGVGGGGGGGEEAEV